MNSRWTSLTGIFRPSSSPGLRPFSGKKIIEPIQGKGWSMSPVKKTPEAKVPDYYNTSRKEILTFIPATCNRLLDVGCSEGAFGHLVKETFGAEVWGVDPSSSVSETTAKVLDHFMNHFFSDELNLPKQYFDVARMFSGKTSMSSDLSGWPQGIF